MIERRNEFGRWFLALKDFHRPALDKEKNKDFQGGPVVKNPLWNTGDPGSIPGGGTKILCAEEQWSQRAVTTSPSDTRESVHHKEISYMMEKRSHMLQLRPDAAE